MVAKRGDDETNEQKDHSQYTHGPLTLIPALLIDDSRYPGTPAGPMDHIIS